ncbi:MAG: TIGR01458 family HAD-type hydrolase [Actinomycetota bacterium]
MTVEDGATLDIDGLLLDIDGVLTVSWQPIEGAVDALAELRRRDMPLRFATNTTTRTRADVAVLLRQAGFEVAAPEILTAPAATATYLRREYPGARCFLLNSGDLSADLTGIEWITDGPADVVVIGGAGLNFTHAQLNRAFGLLLDGAAFVAMHRNLYWRTGGGLELDTGAYVRALEDASGISPVVLGKPSPEFFGSGVTELGCPAGRVAMVGDDIDNDVLGAQRAGLHGVLVRTGKYRAEVEAAARAAGSMPEIVIDGLGALPALLAPG